MIEKKYIYSIKHVNNFVGKNKYKSLHYLESNLFSSLSIESLNKCLLFIMITNQLTKILNKPLAINHTAYASIKCMMVNGDQENNHLDDE